VSRWLLRVSVGLEPLDELWERFQEAFEAGQSFLADQLLKADQVS
jgi:hypothetical protein